MSRSYKHVPCCRDYNRGMKKRANRYVRRNFLIVPSGKAYKKYFCSFEICDYKLMESFPSFRSGFYRYVHGKYTDKELYRIWYRDYKMK
ncbi:MAG: hypothetical protein K2H91_03775 [Lachnospiraceae bacterium]|nr:hypothetical protein [Lachnospiraceae bacterium]